MNTPSVRLGIVGSEGAKFTPETEALARAAIRDLFTKYNPRKVVSGGCHLGGIDIWAVKEARALGIPTEEYKPDIQQWAPANRYGYKARNEDIVKNSDVVVCITLDKLPASFTGPDYGECYHHKGALSVRSTHVKSGGCWTMELAKRKGKHGELVVINTPALLPQHKYERTGTLAGCRETADGYHVTEAGDNTCILCFSKLGTSSIRIPIREAR
jgi:hypothetical protein